MKCIVSQAARNILLPVLFPLCMFLSLPSAGQSARSFKGEAAFCEIVVTGKVVAPGTASKGDGISPPVLQSRTYKPLLNQMGHFDQVSNLAPQQKVPVSIGYPNGRPGEKIAIVVLDGGVIDDNEKAKIVELDRRKRILFNFQPATDEGLYRVAIRKGNDIKVVQLWVGAEITPVKR
ncbi:MAG: hypothetical protein WCF67_20165 [Chitinophagaceae bacterium]